MNSQIQLRLELVELVEMVERLVAGWECKWLMADGSARCYVVPSIMYCGTSTASYSGLPR